MRWWWLSIGGLLAACGGAETSSAPIPAATDSSSSSGGATPPPGTTPPPGGTTSSSGAPPPSSTDGTPTRVACTSSFGSALTTAHGRLDGYLVSIVPESTRNECNADSSHVHLQVKANGAVYDVAVNLDTLEATTDIALPGGAWSEGWHANSSLDYPTDLSLHSSAFTTTTSSAERMHIESALANANHVAIWATGYDPTGAHLVHRQGGGRDGAIAIDPLDPKAHVLAFRFSTDSF
ncbi:MAG TPA: hypothetical protein VIF62_20215 [Labilithrix sp.]|jgi:hypothetical protein